MSRIGVDIGGTFTDLVHVGDDGRVETMKVPSTPSNPSEGAMTAVRQASPDPSTIDVFDHGTTVATNVLIERNPGARIVYLTNEGFSDIPEIMRTERENQYDRQWEKPDPLVDRTDRHGIPGRITADGEERAQLDEEYARSVVREYADRDEAVSYAVSTLYSFENASHERAIASIIEEAHPEAFASSSHEIFPQAMEYERASTVIANAYVKPAMQEYIRDLQSAFRDLGGTAPVNIMQSNGGLLPVSEVLDVPAKTLFSGPAAGVAGAGFFGADVSENIISVDMGGTSSDVGLIRDGSPVYTTQGDIEWGIPVQFPQIDIETVGAGGGSIAWVDSGGLLRVGPRSAGADPGPVCYGRGGTQPTVTDANLVLGRLNPATFAGGEVDLDVAAAETAIAELGEQIGMSPEETALGILEIGMNTLTQTIRTATVERGYDPRDFSLVAFGGAGPMHAAKVASIANISQVIVPPNPGVLSAAGLMTTDFRYDQLHSFIDPVETVADSKLDELNGIVDEMVDDGMAVVREQEGMIADVEVEIEADLRYLEQAYEVTVELASDTPITADDVADATDRFHRRHEQLYGHSNREDTVELVNVLVNLVGTRPVPDQLTDPPTSDAGSVADARKSTRTVVFQDGPVETPIYDRDSLPVEARIEGPFVIEEDQSTTVGFPGQEARLSPSGNLLIEEGDR
jgi:N-methylhydantoinase A